MPTHHRGPEHERRALDAYVKLVRAAESVAARIDRHLAEHELTAPQFNVLEALHHLGTLCARDLAEKLRRSGGNLTLVLDNLERRKLVRRERADGNRKYVFVSLTAGGERLIGELFPAHAGRVEREMRALSARELDELGALCRKVGRPTPDERA